MPLTDAQIKSLKADGKRIRRSDAGGLFIDIMPSGSKVFRLAYRFGGKQRTTWIGDYPETRLSDARIKAAEVKKSLREGIDPHAATDGPIQTVYNGPNWEEVAKDYLMLRQRDGAAPRTLQKLDRQVGVTISELGQRSIKEITPEDILAVVNPIAEKGFVENAHEIRSRFSQIFRFAIARGLATHDPAAVTIDAMVKRRRGEFAGITDPDEVGKLMHAIHQYRQDNWRVGTALLLSAYLFPRNSELRGMKWSELNLKSAMWEIPAERMKMKREHLVPLPKQAIDILNELKLLDFGTDLVFAAPRDPRKMISDATFNAGLRAMGYTKNAHVHHGFRTTASTNLNEMGWNSDWIERQLAHVPANKVRSSYNKAEYIAGRAKMMQAYADWLDIRYDNNS